MGLVDSVGGFDTSGIEGVTRVIARIYGAHGVVFFIDERVEACDIGFIGSSAKALGKGRASASVSRWLWEWILGGHERGKMRDNISVNESVTDFSKLLGTLILDCLETGDKSLQGVDTLRPVSELIDVCGEAIVA
jgi:hypothetical protein